MRAGAEQSCPGPQDRSAEPEKLADRLRRVGVHAGDQLDLAGMKLGFYLSGHFAEPREDRRRAVGLAAGDRIDQEQFLLDPHGERLAGAEAVIRLGFGSHIRSMAARVPAALWNHCPLRTRS